MTERPLAVVVGIISQGKHVLLLRRKKGTYAGLWALPGGKIEYGEHLEDAIRREIYEETGIETTFKEYAGTLSEHLLGREDIDEHFLLHVCRLSALSSSLEPSSEGEPAWISIEEIDDIELITSDRQILQEMLEGEPVYRHCTIDKTSQHDLVYFGDPTDCCVE